MTATGQRHLELLYLGLDFGRLVRHANRQPSGHLYLSDLDLIIRTIGEVRLSGFLLWQSVHSELHFTDVNWPAFRQIDYLRAIRSFQRRERRYGS